MVGCLILVISFSVLAWMGVGVKWKDHGLTLRFGPEEVPEITEQDLIRLFRGERSVAQIAISK